MKGWIASKRELRRLLVSCAVLISTTGLVLAQPAGFEPSQGTGLGQDASLIGRLDPARRLQYRSLDRDRRMDWDRELRRLEQATSWADIVERVLQPPEHVRRAALNTGIVTFFVTPGLGTALITSAAVILGVTVGSAVYSSMQARKQARFEYEKAVIRILRSGAGPPWYGSHSASDVDRGTGPGTPASRGAEVSLLGRVSGETGP
jgi:hypothetical protein